MSYKVFKKTYHITLYGRNDANREITGNTTPSSKRAEQIAIVATPYITNMYSPYINSKTYRFNLNHKFDKIATGSKVILIYARIAGITGSKYHRTLRLCGATGTNTFDTERGMTANPILCVYGEGGATDVNYYNQDPSFGGLEVPETFLSKGFIEIEFCTNTSTGDLDFLQAEIDDLCLSFIIVEPEEVLTNDPNLAPKVNTKSLATKSRVPTFN